MTINTKFNVGDLVWFIEFECTHCEKYLRVSNGLRRIERINTTTPTAGSPIGYCLQGLGETQDEADCFASRDEAQAECDRRNAEIRR